MLIGFLALLTSCCENNYKWSYFDSSQTSSYCEIMWSIYIL